MSCIDADLVQESDRREYLDRTDLRPEEIQEEGSRFLGRHQRPDRFGHRSGSRWRRSVSP